MDMEELILAEMKALAESVKPEWPILHQNKWLARSGLQKAIRRGRAEQAWACGDILFADDKAYAWKALATVIVEDVGFGDPDLLSYAALSTLSTITNKMPSPKRLFMAMIGRACESYKTRSACELSLGTEKDPDMDWPAFRRLSIEDLSSVMFSDAEPPTLYAATSVMRARCRAAKNGALLNVTLELIMDEIDDPQLKRAAMLNFERNVDSMNLSIWPLVSRKLYAGVFVEADKMPPEIEIGGLSSATFDMHTQDGKRAIKAFHTSLTKKGVPEFVALAKLDGPTIIRALGSLIFILEGGQLDRRIMSAHLQALKNYQDRNFALAWGVPPELYGPLLQLMAENFDVLNEKRKWSHGVAG